MSLKERIKSIQSLLHRLSQRCDDSLFIDGIMDCLHESEKRLRELVFVITLNEEELPCSISLGMFSVLPMEMHLHVFAFLDIKSIGNVIRVCSLWNDNKNFIWKNFMTTHVPIFNGKPLRIPSSFEGDWKWIVLSFHHEHLPSTMTYDIGFEKVNDHFYAGEWYNGRSNGKGFIEFKGGYRYEGEWEDNKKHGHGKVWYPSGDRYEGEFHHDEKNGTGTFWDTYGSKYEGEWKDGKKHGRGKVWYSSGDRYEGEFHHDEKNGTGTFWCKGGSKYEGEWCYGVKHGTGSIYYSNGEIYKGEWKNNQRYGYGTFYYPNGNEYEGGVFDDSKGNGTFMQVSGEIRKGYGGRIIGEQGIFVGVWDGLKAKGTAFLPNGDTFHGKCEIKFNKDDSTVMILYDEEEEEEEHK